MKFEQCGLVGIEPDTMKVDTIAVLSEESLQSIITDGLVCVIVKRDDIEW